MLVSLGRFAGSRHSCALDGVHCRRAGDGSAIRFLRGIRPRRLGRKSRIADALIEYGRGEIFRVTFVDLPPTDYAEGGATVAKSEARARRI